MTTIDGKHWEFHVFDGTLHPFVAPVLAAHYDDGPLPADLPGLLSEGQFANVWRYADGSPDGSEGGPLGPLAYLRLSVICDHLAQVLRYSDAFTEAAHDPVIDRGEVREWLTGRFAGTHDQHDRRCMPVTEPHLAPLVQARNPDDFATPVDTATVIDQIVDVVADAIEAGKIHVDATEPYDSCAGCGGYHNVNWEC